MDSIIKKTVLDNGLTVVSEKIPAVRSVSSGIWINSGSSHENSENTGIAHFIEHMLFKGTGTRSAQQIASALEDRGGSLNAYTAKELIVYHAHCLDTHLSDATELLADLVSNPLFNEQDIENERSVVLEEIRSTLDTPEDHIGDLFMETMFPSQPMGYPILGRKNIIKKLNKSQISAFWKEHYHPKNMVFAAAGNIDHENLTELVSSVFQLKSYDKFVPAIINKSRSVLGKRTEVAEHVNQTHVCFGTEGLSYLHPNRFDLIALNTYLGDGMSSRLFQLIREKYGLAYSVYSYIDFFHDTGVLSFYMGIDHKNENQATEILFQELRELAGKPLPKDSVEKIKTQLKGRFLLGLENTEQHMSRLAKNEIFFKRFISVKEVLLKIEAISANSLLELSQKLFNIQKINIVKINPVN